MSKKVIDLQKTRLTSCYVCIRYRAALHAICTEWLCTQTLPIFKSPRKLEALTNNGVTLFVCTEHCQHTCWLNYTTWFHTYEEWSRAADAGSRWFQCKYTCTSSVTGMHIVIVMYNNVSVQSTSSGKSVELNFCEVHCTAATSSSRMPIFWLVIFHVWLVRWDFNFVTVSCWSHNYSGAVMARRFLRFLENPVVFGKISRPWNVLENGFGPGKSWKC